MPAEIASRDRQRLAGGPASLIWTAVIVGGCVCLSPVFACATPFAALATLAALYAGGRNALLVVGLAWLGNQSIGYGVSGYPWTWDSVAWGLAIGGAACLGVVAAQALSTVKPAPMSVSLPFIGAFAVYELGLYAMSFVLPGSVGGFTTSVVGYVFLVNAAGLVILIVMYHLLSSVGRLLVSDRQGADVISGHI